MPVSSGIKPSITPGRPELRIETGPAPKNALSKSVQPDAALAAVVGKDPLPRTELTKKLWAYIRKHELQDPKEKRNIRADENLLAVFDGKKVVSMFSR
jgi:upstream activation factor subunit UAF30